LTSYSPSVCSPVDEVAWKAKIARPPQKSGGSGVPSTLPQPYNGADVRGKDSPQVATNLAQYGDGSVWQVEAGGRMGGVLGEDAVEISAGASPCVQQCQAQDRVRGSLPVPGP
jgi:hypothetical protein